MTFIFSGTLTRMRPLSLMYSFKSARTKLGKTSFAKVKKKSSLFLETSTWLLCITKYASTLDTTGRNRSSVKVK